MKNVVRHIKRHANKAYGAMGLGDTAVRSRLAARFAKKYNLMYFRSNNATTSKLVVVRGCTASVDQEDSNICIGVHNGYDMVLLERRSTIEVPDHSPSKHTWQILQIDLRKHTDLPYVFMGTAGIPRALYAKILHIRREVGLADISENKRIVKAFHAHHSVLASPAEGLFLYQLLNEEITDSIARHREPYAIEIDGDSLYIITESSLASNQSLTKMMHYGLWLAEHIDSIKR